MAGERRVSDSRDSGRKTAVAITSSPRLGRIIHGTRVNVEQPLLRSRTISKEFHTRKYFSFAGMFMRLAGSCPIQKLWIKRGSKTAG